MDLGLIVYAMNLAAMMDLVLVKVREAVAQRQ